MRIVDAKTLTAQLEQLPPNPRIVCTGSVVPQALLRLVDSVVPEYRLYMLNAQGELPRRDGVVYESSFVGPGMRKYDNLRYYPARLSLVPRFFNSKLPPDLVLLNTTPVKDNATVSLGVELNILPKAIDAAKARGAMVVAMLNKHQPYTYGDSVRSVEDIDFGIEIDEPLITFPPAPADDDANRIGELIAARVPDGATLQTGIGAMPDAVLSQLTHRKDLGIWTEMMSDGVLYLERAGALNKDRPIVCSFLLGTQELYDWVHENPRVRVLCCTKTNEPGNIANQPAMTSVNTAMQVDLFVEANASRVHHKIYSGTGGQTDFIVGAMHSPGGHAYLAMRSWHPKANVSTIVGKIKEPTTSLQMSAVVTEQGLADLYCKTQEQQAWELIEHAAHPQIREQLRQEAVEYGLFKQYPSQYPSY